jgi:signal transduction histidine kinase
MRTRTARRIAWSLWGLSLAVLGGGLLLTWLNRSTLNSDTATFYGVLVLASLGYSTVGALIASRRPDNPIGWIFCVMAVGFAGTMFSQEYAVRGIAAAPHSLPAVDWIGYQAEWLLLLGTAPIILVFLLFPSGTVQSARWRIVVWLALASFALGSLGGLLQPATDNGINDRYPNLGFLVPNPFGVPGLKTVTGIALAVAAYGSLMAGFVSVVALALRARRARGEERQQLKWLAYTAAAAAATFLFWPLAGITGNLNLFGDLFWTSITAILCLGIPIASGIAILKYRLYDLDIVVKKTVVFGLLAAFITLVYVVVVGGVGAIVGSHSNSALTFAAAAIVAVAFQPLRTRARRVADRVVYGKRATPYEVLSDFSERAAGTYSTDDVLPRMVQILATGTGAAEAHVWLRVGSELRPAASWPADGAQSSVRIAGDELPAFPGGEHAFEVRHGSELLGAITVAMPPSEPLRPDQEKLLNDVASQTALVLRNVRLIEELRESRRRIVAAQDSERRKLERNIHDGAQQQLVGLAVKLRLLDAAIAKDPEAARGMAAQLQAEAGDALENLRDLARGIYPPLLADQGLVAALESQARKAPLPVTVEANGSGRYGQEVEAAVYFCCLEALQNVAKYAGASHASVRLRSADAQLEFQVTDDGRGFDPGETSFGTGLQGMSDRLDAVGGTIEVRASRGQGTVITGRVPVGPPERDPL